jgi:hypothetical protein
MTDTVIVPACRTFGCIGLVRCDYCDQLLDQPETRAALLAARRLRNGDLHGAHGLIKAAAMLQETA